MTPAAFQTLPDSSSSTRAHNDIVRHLQLPLYPSSTSQQPNCPWQLPALFNSSICTTAAVPALAGGSTLAAGYRDWPLLPSDDTTGSNSSDDSPRAHHPDATSTTDTVANVLMLLGDSSSNYTSAPAGDNDGSTTDDDDDSLLAVAGVSAAMHCVAITGCPPNVPMRRPPPVMLLPAQELPGRMMTPV
jgi:hypothetical protein